MSEPRPRPRTGAKHRARRPERPSPPDRLWLYGLHTVAAALGNERRVVHRVLATANAGRRLREAGAMLPETAEEASPRAIDRLLGAGAVHQGVAAEVAPLDNLTLNELATAHRVVVLDQVTDPHNVGAILRSAAAFGVEAVVTTARHAPAETGVLAKAASGALDRLPLIAVTNLARALGEIGRLGFLRVGLDSEADDDLADVVAADRIALVLGAEGKGLRQLTRRTCDRLARLAVPGDLASLNVSNAAAVALYVVSRNG